MKLLRVEVTNFASYNHLEFTFDSKGLTLISGPTGSGKSTLCDVVPWLLFGRTAKGGAVDDIRTWDTSEPTNGEIRFSINDKYYEIHRSRKPNDLCIVTMTETIRGNDMTDTQRLINELLGFDYSLYMSGAYFHEFSTTASFFVTTAKIRRQITEQLVDLNLAKRLQEFAKDYRKQIKAELDKMSGEFATTNALLLQVTNSIESDTTMAKEWDAKRGVKRQELEVKAADLKIHYAKKLAKVLKEHKKTKEDLEIIIADIKKEIIPDIEIQFYKAALTEERKAYELTKGSKCVACGSPLGENKEIILLKKEHELAQRVKDNEANKRDLAYRTKELERHLTTEVGIKKDNTDAENPYLQQLAAMKDEENPYVAAIDKRNKEKAKLNKSVKHLKTAIDDFEVEYHDVELLLEVTDTFRAALVKNTVIDLETSTNKILSDYFDSEFQVKFELSDTDKLETTITKNGNTCVYTQLSKGQRQLLKLSFAISVMKCVSNHHGIHFNAIFLDESLDGLDDQLKVKAYDLLQQLATEHDSVLVVEHNEALKSLFPNRYEVTLTNEGSEIETA